MVKNCARALVSLRYRLEFKFILGIWLFARYAYAFGFAFAFCSRLLLSRARKVDLFDH